jgi:hypothetical protein
VCVQLAGMVQSTSDGIMFGTLHALVKPSELIGIRSLQIPSTSKTDNLPEDKKGHSRTSSLGDNVEKPKVTLRVTLSHCI